MAKYNRQCKWFLMEYVGNPGAVPACNQKKILEAFDCSNCDKETKASDMVDVVRCKDCRYYPSGKDNGEEQEGFGLMWSDEAEYKCPFYCADEWYSRKPRPDFFCANGEHRR